MPDAEVQWPEEITPTRPVCPAAMDAAEEERKPPRNVSLTEPASLWTTAQGGPAFYAYSTNYPVDVDAGIIVDVEASPARRTDEVLVGGNSAKFTRMAQWLMPRCER